MHILFTRPIDDSKELILRFKSLGHIVSNIPVIIIKKKEYLKTFFNAYWQDNVDLTIDKNIKQLLNKLNIDDLPTFGIPTKPHLNPIVVTI